MYMYCTSVRRISTCRTSVIVAVSKVLPDMSSVSEGEIDQAQSNQVSKLRPYKVQYGVLTSSMKSRRVFNMQHCAGLY